MNIFDLAKDRVRFFGLWMRVEGPYKINGPLQCNIHRYTHKHMSHAEQCEPVHTNE